MSGFRKVQGLLARTWSGFGKRNAPRRSDRKRTLTLEPLESRQMLSVSAAITRDYSPIAEDGGAVCVYDRVHEVIRVRRICPTLKCGVSGWVDGHFADFSFTTSSDDLSADSGGFQGWIYGKSGTITLTSHDDQDTMNGEVLLELDDAQWQANNPGPVSGAATIQAPSSVSVVIIDDDGGGNTPPTADAGGPYSVNEGSSITLSGSGSSDSEGTIASYEWDFDNDGYYDDATGVSPSFSGGPAGRVRTIRRGRWGCV